MTLLLFPTLNLNVRSIQEGVRLNVVVVVVPFTWLGHATFLFQSPGGKRIVIDPWITGNPASPELAKKLGPLDLILVTHGHRDHTERRGPLTRSSGAHVVAPFELSEWLQGKGLKTVTGMNPGGTLQMLGMSITMVPAFHSSSIDEDGAAIYLGVATGYVIKFENALTIYFAGDTCVFGDMRLIAELYRPTIGFPPDRRSLHDGTGAGGEGLRTAGDQAGGSDALRDVPGADRHAGRVSRACRAARCAGAGVEAGRDSIVANPLNPESRIRVPNPSPESR